MHFYYTILLDLWHQKQFAVYERKNQVCKKISYVFLFLFSDTY